MKLLLIFPCYNEEEVLPDSSKKIFAFFQKLIDTGKISKESRICFVDDGSKDKTWNIIAAFDNEYVNAVKLSTNFGHQKALLAGLETFKDDFDVYVTLDVDLQDDINVVAEMLALAKKGNNIVYGVRNDRTTDSFFKRFTANAFYTVMQKLGVKTIPNHADFRLIDHKALQEFLKFKETHLFLRAIFPAIGLQSDIVYYKRLEREKGSSKYPLKKMLKFAWDGVTSFSDTPLKFVLFIGVFSLILSLLLGVWAVIQLLRGEVITGWFSTISLIIFFGGIQALALGIIGEYIGKIFMQTKERPRFIVEKVIKK